MHDRDRVYLGCEPAGRLTTALEALCLLAAVVLLVANLVRLASTVGLQWWVPVVALAAGFAADLASGLVHWAADTWGRETLPVLGPRFLRPFRVHHVNPHDFLGRSFLDCNGDVAMLTLPVLVAPLLLAADGGWRDVLSVGLVAYAGWSLPTNQVHQWAHMPEPPRIVRWLQRHRVILGHEAHQQHHLSPYAMNYCIATGWCNAALTAGEAFRRLERVVTRWTGLVPRADDEAFAQTGQATGQVAGQVGPRVRP